MQALVSSDELAKDISGAETLLERHQEHKTEIDARAPAFNLFDSFGRQLLARQHFASTEIKDKLQSLKKEREAMEKSVLLHVCGTCTCIGVLSAQNVYSNYICFNTQSMDCKKTAVGSMQGLADVQPRG